MAEDPSVIHYRLKNSSICLHVKKPPPYQSGQWTFAEKAVISGNSINPDYAEKVDYEPKNLTLCVRDLNETNSGIYQVSFVDSKFDAITESHRVVVQGKFYAVLTGSALHIHTFLNLVDSHTFHDNKHKIIFHYLDTVKMQKLFFSHCNFKTGQ